MKAIILAGGMGTRLRCITGEHPKPMAMLLGRPMMEHLVLLLRDCGFSELCCTLRYRAGEIMAWFGDGSRFGVKMEYRIETEALGTAGSVGGCRDFVGGDDFLVVSADAACDYRFDALMRARRDSGAIGALALCRSALPLRYGLAVTDADGLIRAFVEKPSWPRVVSDLVNTGVYAFSSRVFSFIPEGKPCDFGSELFPLLLERGEKLRGVTLDGYWRDAGTPQDFYRCCADALDGKLKLTPGPGFEMAAPVPEADGDEEGACTELPCRDRARLMGSLAELMLELGARYDDGIRVAGPGWNMHISPRSGSSAVRIAVQSEDVELARALCLSAREVAEKLETGGNGI